ncbi:MAG: hypothetical protein FWH11_11440 [Micrococcales bacterium]|nr:hypothetical protein [Micrococcales bacterium]
MVTIPVVVATRRLAVLLGVAALALTAGCTSPDPKTETTSPAHQVSTPSAEEDQAVTDATAALHRFYQVRDQCWADPSDVDSTCFDSVVVDQVLTDSRATLDTLRNEGWHDEGNSEVLSVEVVWVNLDGSFKQVRLAACVDQRTRQTFDSSGVPQIPESYMPTAPQRVVWQLINYDYPEAGQWKVSYYPEEEAGSESC